MTELKFTGGHEFHPLSILMICFKAWKCYHRFNPPPPPPLSPTFEPLLIVYIICRMHLAVEVYTSPHVHCHNVERRQQQHFYF